MIIAITPGEPAGIGPDLLIKLVQQPQHVGLLAIADSNMLQQRAQQLDLPLHIISWQPGTDIPPCTGKGEIHCLHTPCATPVIPGQLNVANAAYVLSCLDTAVQLYQQEQIQALVTGPLQKSIINDSGVSFSGHTEYLAEKTGCPLPVMMLSSPNLRVALATTHVALRDIPDLITRPLLEQVIQIIHDDMQKWFGIAAPRIAVCGLNPHAGEEGHLGREEIDHIQPAIQALQQQGMQLSGPWPADTIFTPQRLQDCDVVLAMYHDQGLATLKYDGFGQAVNITLGLNMIRTSVDHGTALHLAATGEASITSLLQAIQTAQFMASHHAKQTSAA